MTHKPALLPVMIGTGFGAGFWPWGPGTAGSVVATALWFLLHAVLPLAVLQAVTVVLILLFTLLGTWATQRLMPFWGDDPSRVVVDEMVGVWVALLVADDVWTALLALLLFRFFDIVKPLGIRALDRRRGAFWVMADDLLAGLYAAVLILLLQIVLNNS
ncbi:MAG: phosphatidylglycerophosphatase A [Prevotella sp.]|nr:phosphatidylglycerophosphatase A [Prevotella sp.]